MASPEELVAAAPPVAAEQEKYFMEHNSLEIERLSYQHEVIQNHMGGNLVLAPIDLTQPRLRVLDSATADGLWLRSLLPSLSSPSLLLGTDIVPAYFPATSPAPITLKIQSITQPWPTELRSSFDLVHQRFALPAAGHAHIRTALHALVGLVKPGGWIQLVEADHGVFEGAAMRDLFVLVKALFGALGVPYAHACELRSWLNEEGLHSVREQMLDVRLGKKNAVPELGKKSVEAFALAARGIVDAARQAGTQFGEEWLEALPGKVRGELEAEGGVNRVYCVWGQRAE